MEILKDKDDRIGKIINSFFVEAGYCISTRTPGNFNRVRKALKDSVIDVRDKQWIEVIELLKAHVKRPTSISDVINTLDKLVDLMK